MVLRPALQLPIASRKRPKFRRRMLRAIVVTSWPLGTESPSWWCECYSPMCCRPKRAISRSPTRSR